MAGIFVMLVWPWIFFGIVWAKGGLELSTRSGDVITDHPQATSFFVTFLGNIVCLIINILFSIAIIRFAQEWVANRTAGEKKVSVFHVSLLAAFRNQNWPWKVADRKFLIAKQRWLQVALVGICVFSFSFVPSSIASLINPVVFHRTVDLVGKELDFASSEPDCLNWFNAVPITSNCDWTVRV